MNACCQCPIDCAYCDYVCSVVENMPPVVLTDEEICLEVVERSGNVS